MSYRTLMAHADIGGKNDDLFRLAGNLAERFEAKVIGVAACMPPQPIYYTDAYVLSDFIEQDRVAVSNSGQHRIALAVHNGKLVRPKALPPETFGAKLKLVRLRVFVRRGAMSNGRKR